MSFYQKIDYSRPSVILQEQCIVEALDKVNHQLPGSDNVTHMWTIDGERVYSFMNLHKDC